MIKFSLIRLSKRLTTMTNNNESESVQFSVVPNSLWPQSPLDSSVCGILQARILKWVAIPFSRGSSWPRNWTWVSRIAGRFFTVWATKEAPANNNRTMIVYCNENYVNVVSQNILLYCIHPSLVIMWDDKLQSAYVRRVSEVNDVGIVL